jgi:hypothetical protein
MMLEDTNVSEDLVASIFRVRMKAECTMNRMDRAFSEDGGSKSLETLVCYHISTQCHNREDHDLMRTAES